MSARVEQHDEAKRLAKLLDERIDKAFAARPNGGCVLVGTKDAATIARLLSSLPDAERAGMERAAKIEAPAPRSHTYASENADSYIAFEHGWNAGVTAHAAAIRAAAKGE